MSICVERRFETKDIVRRLGVLTPQRVHLKNHPISTPVAVFNPAAIINDDELWLYARIILGYYMYVSAIARVEIPLSDILEGMVSWSHYPAEIVICPDMKYDVCGAEDPRVTEVDGQLCMVYAGRTVNYFSQVMRERTLPVVAVSRDGIRWKKVGAFVYPRAERRRLVSDKDAFVTRIDGSLILFHRPHFGDDRFYLAISKIRELPRGKRLQEIELKETYTFFGTAPFETKIGWGTPLVEVEPGRYVALLHGVDKEIKAYRVFAALIRSSGGMPRLEAVTPYYIMEPRYMYEVYGDRPLVVFPCGLVRVDDSLIITYGAADYVVGFGELKLDVLMSHLDRGAVS